jgi:GDP-L-fucose synthase
MIKTMTDFKGVLTHDLTKPDGTPAKLMDSSRLFQLGWKPQVNLSDGLQQVYQWFLDHH